MLMVAMRTEQFRMAEFLIDIGIDCNYEIDLVVSIGIVLH